MYKRLFLLVLPAFAVSLLSVTVVKRAGGLNIRNEIIYVFFIRVLHTCSSFVHMTRERR